MANSREGGASDPDIDRADLKAELDQIKDAMGLGERYPAEFRLWLVFGVLVFAASLASQYVLLRGLPSYLHGLVWFGFMGAGGAYQWYTVDRDDWSRAGGEPSAYLQAGAVFSLYVVYVLVLGPALDPLPEQQASLVLFSLIVALVGVAYLVMGNTLNAYNIRKLDRYAFYVGGGWMLVLAAAMPNVGFLRTWGYAVYGALFLLHSVGSYIVLDRTT